MLSLLHKICHMISEIIQVIGFKYIVKDAETSEIYENTYGHKPIEFMTGQNQILPALENEILKIPVGEERKVYLEQPYGPYDTNAIINVPRSQVGNISLEKNMILYAKGPHGETIQVTVLDFDDQTVQIDHNHPMAGKNLIFKTKVVKIRPATQEELSHGHLHTDEHSCGCGSGCGCH